MKSIFAMRGKYEFEVADIIEHAPAQWRTQGGLEGL